uniref:Laminin subunit beta-1 n=2 Tax=Parascaris TaxID=6254 RepID=A0A915C6Q9_PARUN
MGILRSPVWSIVVLVIFLASVCAEFAEEDLCSERSCYPATGNLLVGRKHRLSATSTCGIHGRQRYCIVSHLEEQTKCFYCDSRTEWRPHREPHRLSHRIENVVSESYEDRSRNWWQSENGVQNVSIRLDLEAEFHFTHLIMTFKSFRPAAMIIERSADFGKTWSPYRYFAYDCASTFPNIPEGPPKKHSDVICTRKYSDVAPSTGGELVYKVISPHIRTENPYSDEIANLLKVTNLRINFTKLHTLGDDLLDYRPEIDEKYYYAVYELVVRGSCSCYGHAQRCIPIENSAGVAIVSDRPDMVHGRCECTHNTKGLNCEQCMDFFNDLPWRPAIGDDSNECKRCNCNGHAARCHFDRAVYQASGFVSGGVCDECMHNTQGKNCEQCKPFYYRNPQRPITDPYVCLPCECDKAGSLNEGICEGEEDPERGLVAGKCYCKSNVDGSRCDHCKNGFWSLSAEDPNGCRACKCHLLGTFNNEGCNKRTGECLCKRLVTGENCDRCLPEHYGLSEEPDGCRACDCDIGGAVDNYCDVISGQCKCRAHFSGRRCDTADSSYYCANIDHYTYEAEQANITNGEVQSREYPLNVRDRTWTGEGFVRANERTSITFRVDNLAQSMRYNIIIRYEAPHDPLGWENVQLTIVRPSDPSPDGVCSNALPSDDFLIVRLHAGGRYAEVRPDVCLEAHVPYEIRLQMGEKRTGVQDRSASILIDSIVLVPPTDVLPIFKGSPVAEQHKLEFDRYQCRNQALSLTPTTDLWAVCSRYVCPVAAIVFNESLECNCDPTGSVSGICAAKGGQCDCKPNVVGRRCDRCAVGTYGFGPSGCTACECDSVGSLSNICDKQSGQCLCRERGITGRQCNQCQPGFWSFPDCRVCQCNDHASICDQKTGACIECRDLTDGYYCDRCKDGYYGDPRLGINLPCKPCPCPGGLDSGFQHADTCYLRPNTDSESPDVVCNCKAGYTGERCASCAINHWGNPNELGGTCERCDCNGNIDLSVEGSCDAVTGECIKCLHNTEGIQCENCIEGYFGDAKIRSCQRCVCNELGTNLTVGACDRVSGQCACLPNVVGQQCDTCAPQHFDLASGTGCEPCNCDSNGVLLREDNTPELQCNEFDGRCPCKRGRGGRTCSDCEDYYWGDPMAGECKRCQCDPIGSASQQCHRNNGTCTCLLGSGGALCNECARGYTGRWPHCEACGECYRNWDDIIQKLKSQVASLIEKANNIEDTGVASIYDAAFEKMEANLAEVKSQLESANITKADVDTLQEQMDSLLEKVNVEKERLNVVGKRITDTTSAVDNAEEELKSLIEIAEKLTARAQALNENATLLREADVQGAYNISRESAEKSAAAKRRTDDAVAKIASAESDRREAEMLLDKNQLDFERQFTENEMALQHIDEQLSAFESVLPALNKDVCGADSAPCDALCGGPGSCGYCGGRSCLAGSVSKAEQALQFADEADRKLNEKQKEAEEILSRVREILMDTSMTRSKANDAHDVAEAAAKQANQTRMALEGILEEINEFLDSERSSPEQIRTLAEEITNMTISLTPEQIQDLADKIRENLMRINNIDSILEETRGNKTIAAALQNSAESASQRAAEIRNTTTAVREALKRTSEAQEAAKRAIDDAMEQIAEARTDLESADEETKIAEDLAAKSNESLVQLENEMKDVRVQYLQISEHAKNAYEAADKAMQQATLAEAANDQLKADFNTAKELLASRQSGNEKPQARAEALRKRATQLLHKTQRYRSDISQLTADMDASDVRLGEYNGTVADLESQIDHISARIRARIEYYATCDV